MSQARLLLSFRWARTYFQDPHLCKQSIDLRLLSVPLELLQALPCSSHLQFIGPRHASDTSQSVELAKLLIEANNRSRQGDMDTVDISMITHPASMPLAPQRVSSHDELLAASIFRGMLVATRW